MKRTEELVEEVLNGLDDLHGITPEQIPDIGLYMDQVTSLVEENLTQEKRYPEDKVLTKTMINNYTKNHLLPPPDKKKYSRDHVLIMILIYYYKSEFSFRDIEQLLLPLTEGHFHTQGQASLSGIYDRLFDLCEGQTQALKDDIREKMRTAGETFECADEDDAEYLTLFTLISELFSDIYVKKKVMEYLIDKLAEDNERKNALARKKK